MDTFGIAVIGAGRIGTTRSRIASKHPATRVVAVVDIDIGRARALADEVGAAIATVDVAEAVGRPDVHAVLVATPEHTHTPPILQALEAGKPVMSDTPMALSMADANTLVDAAARAGVPYRIAHTPRYQRQYQVAKENIERGALGRVIGGTVRVYNSRAQAFQILKRCPQVSPVVDVLVYWIDMVTWFMAPQRVVEVHARGNGEVFRNAGYDVDDLVWATLKFSDGAVVSAGIAYALPEHYPTLGQSPRLELIGTHGVLSLEDERRNHFMYSEHGVMHGYVPNHALKSAFLGSSSYGDWAQGEFWGPLADETRAFIELVRTGRPATIPTAEQARRTLATTLAIDESARTGATVRLDVP